MQKETNVERVEIRYMQAKRVGPGRAPLLVFLPVFLPLAFQVILVCPLPPTYLPSDARLSTINVFEKLRVGLFRHLPLLVSGSSGALGVL